MKLGILSDTHNQLVRTRAAVAMLREAGAAALVHCGDFTQPPILAACGVLPLWFVFGNNDSDAVAELQHAANECGAVCLGWSGIVEFAGKRIDVTHGHMATDTRRVLEAEPEYLFSGHSHMPLDIAVGSVRRINPGALHRADEHTVALLDLGTGELTFLVVPR